MYEEQGERRMKQSVEYNRAYREGKSWVIEHGIPRWFINISEDNSRGVFKAINDFGVLSDEEELVYNKYSFSVIFQFRNIY